MRPDLVITGFGPFHGMKDNPSSRLVKRLAGERRFARLGIRVRTELLPVTYDAVGDAALKIAGENPRILLMVGVAGKAKRIRLELIGENRAALYYRDAAGKHPAPVLAADAPARLHTRRFTPLAEALVRTNPRLVLSRNAGRYLCNALYFHALNNAGPETIALFVHIPRLRPVMARKNDRRPDLEGLRRFALLLISRLLRIAPR